MEPIIKEKRSYLSLLLSILAVIIITIVSFFLYQYFTQPVPLATPATLESYGLTEPLDPDNRPFGTITYTKYSEATAETDSLPYIYQYNFETDTEDLSSSQSFTEAVSLSATTTLVIKDNTIALYDRTTETLTTLPHQPNSVLSDLTISPDQTRYAYSYREPDIADPDNLGAYSIAIHTFGSEGVEVISEGAKPMLLSESVVYMTRDALYTYNFTTTDTTPIFNLYHYYTQTDNYTISPDATTLILTIPTLSLISVATIENNIATEVGRIITPDTTYQNPTFTEDGQFYTVQASDMSGAMTREVRGVRGGRVK